MPRDGERLSLALDLGPRLKGSHSGKDALEGSEIAGFGSAQPSCEEHRPRGVPVYLRLIRTLDPYANAGGFELMTRPEMGVSRADPYGFRPIANRLPDERTNITPEDSAGVAISSSPIGFVAMCRNVGPAAMTSISPSSLER